MSWLPPTFGGSTDEMLIALQWRRDELLELASDARADDERVRALALTWAADLAVLQAAVLEYLVLESRTPRRRFFEAGERLSHALSAMSDLPPLDELRALMLEALDDDLVPVVMVAWEAVPAFDPPTLDDLEAAALRRTGGRGLEAYADERSSHAATTMLAAQHHRVRQDLPAAMACALESDLATLDAYLAASAAAVGDRYGLTIVSRRELSERAVSGLGLPADFIDAVHLVRATLVNSLGPGDGERVAPSFIPVL